MDYPGLSTSSSVLLLGLYSSSISLHILVLLRLH